MTIDKTTGIDFGNLNYTVQKAFGNGKHEGYKIVLENGVSLFIRKENIQQGAKIELADPSEKCYANGVKFIGFKNVSIFGSEQRDEIKVIEGKNVYVDVSNNEHGDEVEFFNTNESDGLYTNQFKGDGKDLYATRKYYNIQLPPKGERQFGL